MRVAVAALLLLAAACGEPAPEPAPGLVPPLGAAPPAGERPPNLLLILLDDWGIDRFDGFPGQPDTSARTPVIDELAAEGLLFTRAYAEPLCSPTRAALLTGRYGRTTGVGTGFRWFNARPDGFVLDPHAWQTLPRALGELGYARFAVGKWHLTTPSFEPDPYLHPIAMGFEQHVGVISNLVSEADLDYRTYRLTRASAAGSEQELVTDGTYLTTRQVDDALELIASAGERPWFTFLALTAPHYPWDPPPQELVSVDVSRLDPNDDPACYDAVLEAADTEIGRLLRALNPATRARTVVVLMGDNGTPGKVFPRFEAGRLKKGFASEGGTHVPLVVAGPGVRRGTDDRLVHVVDLHATLLELAGGRSSSPDAVGFAPALGGAPAPRREWVYCAVRKPLGTDPPPRGWVFDRALLRDEAWMLRTWLGDDGRERSELRHLGDALWGDGAEAGPDTPGAEAARARLEAWLAEAEAG